MHENKNVIIDYDFSHFLQDTSILEGILGDFV